MKLAKARARFKYDPYGIVDSRMEYKHSNMRGYSDTMVKHEDVIPLSKKAEEIWYRFTEEIKEQTESNNAIDLHKFYGL